MAKAITFKNKRNENKYIEAIHYKCGHYRAVQFMEYNGERNYGVSKMKRSIRKQLLLSILNDYYGDVDALIKVERK